VPRRSPAQPCCLATCDCRPARSAGEQSAGSTRRRWSPPPAPAGPGPQHWPASKRGRFADPPPRTRSGSGRGRGCIQPRLHRSRPRPSSHPAGLHAQFRGAWRWGRRTRAPFPASSPVRRHEGRQTRRAHRRPGAQSRVQGAATSRSANSRKTRTAVGQRQARVRGGGSRGRVGGGDSGQAARTGRAATYFASLSL